MRSVVLVVCLAALPACFTFGFGPYNAATAALLSSDGTDYKIADDQSDVPDGWVRVFAESIAYRRLPIGVHWGLRGGWLSDGDFSDMHYDVSLKLWKIGVGYTRLSTSTTLKTGELRRSFDGDGNALRLSFAPLPPVSFDLMLASLSGDFSKGMMGSPGTGTMTKDYGVSRQSIGLTLVPWGKGLWNVGVRFDMNRFALDGITEWGPSFELLLTIL